MEQTLTALHDKSEAWSGLGASMHTLWDYRGIVVGKQRNERPAFYGVFLIFLYFGGAWVLNLIAPNLVNVAITIGNPNDVVLLTGNITALANDTETRYVLSYSSSWLD